MSFTHTWQGGQCVGISDFIYTWLLPPLLLTRPKKYKFLSLYSTQCTCPADIPLTCALCNNTKTEWFERVGTILLNILQSHLTSQVSSTHDNNMVYGTRWSLFFNIILSQWFWAQQWLQFKLYSNQRDREKLLCTAGVFSSEVFKWSLTSCSDARTKLTGVVLSYMSCVKGVFFFLRSLLHKNLSFENNLSPSCWFKRRLQKYKKIKTTKGKDTSSHQRSAPDCALSKTALKKVTYINTFCSFLPQNAQLPPVCSLFWLFVSL